MKKNNYQNHIYPETNSLSFSSGMRMRKILISFWLLFLPAFLAFSQKFELVGSFNGWQPEEMPLSYQGWEVYKMTKSLKAGTYEFQVLMDGQWTQRWQGVNRTFTVTKDNTQVTFYARKEGYHEVSGHNWMFYCDAQDFYLCGPAVGSWDAASKIKKMEVNNKKASYVGYLSAGLYQVRVKTSGGLIDNDVMIFANNIEKSGNYAVTHDFERFRVEHEALELKDIFDPFLYISIASVYSATYYCEENDFQDRAFHLDSGEDFTITPNVYTRPVSGNVKVGFYYIIDGDAAKKKSLPLSWQRNYPQLDSREYSYWKTQFTNSILQGLSPGEHTLEFWFEATDGITTCYKRYSNTRNYRIKIHIGPVRSTIRPDVSGIPADKNYILSVVPLDETKDITCKNGTLTIGDKARALVNVTYYDALGRPVQHVQAGITPTGKDLVTLQEYDKTGRETNSWLPAFGTGKGNYTDPDVLKASAKSAGLHNDQRPYGYPVYEASPLNRVTRQHGPGKDWDTGGTGKAVEISYHTNVTSGEEALKCWKLTLSGNTVKKENYPAGEIFVTKTKDEDGNISYDFTDKLGQLILSRRMDGTNAHDTYFFYDDYGNKRGVFPPELSERIKQSSSVSLTSEVVDQYGYLYEYDRRNRCIKKKMPGADWIYYVYDKADRLILSQDGEQRLRRMEEWTLYKYDALGRVVLSGIYETFTSHGLLCDNYAGRIVTESRGNAQYGYTQTFFSTVTDDRILLVNYYDTYDFLSGVPGIPAGLGWEEKEGYGERYINRACSSCSSKGKLTGTRIKKLDKSGEMVSVFYYDDKGRMVQSRSTNHTGGMEIEYMAYDFTGNLTKKLHEHTPVAGGKVVSENWWYEYDHAGRNIATYHRMDREQQACLAENRYNELGQLVGKTLHTGRGTNAANNISFTYNVRGWLTKISSSLFNQWLYYNTGVADMYKSWSGNIGGISWGTDESGLRSYGFTYDGLSRMKKAQFSPDPSSLGVTALLPGLRGTGDEWIEPEAYSEEITGYDKNGNILGIKRDGLYVHASSLTGSWYGTEIRYGNIDDLLLSYAGNQLRNVTERSSSVFKNVPQSMDFRPTSVKGITSQYAYNKNGQMIADYNKYIHNIQYNWLGLPEKIATLHGHEVDYVYDAAGIKRQAVYTTNLNAPTVPITTTVPATATRTHRSVTDYYGNKIYRDGELYMVLNPEGYMTKEGDTWEYRYYMYDHLGNIRVVHDTKGTILETNDYYPFGMPHAKVNDKSVQPYKFAGKELEIMHGINLSDFEARWRGTAIPDFITPDPFQEKYYPISPYAYVANNPLKYVDPDGRKIKKVNFTKRNSRGHLIGTSRQLTSKMNSALDALLITREGIAFFSQFASAGDKLGSVTFKKDGKYSNHTLQINEYSYAEEKINIIPPGFDGLFSTKIDENGNATIKLTIVSLGKDMFGIAETLAHEIFLHGYDTGEIMDGEKEITNDGGDSDHKALKDKDKSHKGYRQYESVQEMLSAIHQAFAEAFRRAEKLAKEKY